MNPGIVYLSMLSDACRNELPELCQDASCENPIHMPADPTPDLTAEADDATILHAESRFEAGRPD